MIRRFVILLVVVALAACSAGGSGRVGGTGTSPSSAGSASPSLPGATGSPHASASAGTSVGSGAGVQVARYADDGAVGAMAAAFLRRSPARELRIEIDWVAGREPSQGSIDHLRSILLGVADKPAGVIVEKDQEIASGRARWTLADVQALERAYRQRRSQGDTATIWMAFLDGEFAGGSGTLGVAYAASSDVIFRDRIDDAATAAVLGSAIERAVVVHEVGHLLGLVNLGYTSSVAHEDAQHPHHSSNPESVMYWQVEDISIRNLLNGGPPSDFDADDRRDLTALRSGA